MPCVTYIIFGLTFGVGAGIFRNTATLSGGDKYRHSSCIGHSTAESAGHTKTDTNNLL